MNLNKRERILAAVTGALFLLIVGKFLFSAVSGSLNTLHARRDALVAEVEKKKARVARGRRATARMSDWRRRSLPVDREMARSLYQNWLLGLVDKVKLDHARVESGEARSRRDIYWRLSFTIRGRGSLEQLTELLWEFYSAGHLQKIRGLSIKPIDDSSKLDLSLSIEALSLPGADSQDKLSAEQPAEPLPGTLAAYRESIVDRNLFGSYVPPPPPPPPVRPKPPAPPPPPPPPGFDHTKYAVVTAILAAGGRHQVWIKMRTTDQQFELFQGDTFKVGSVECKVVRIGPKEVEIEVDGSRRRVRVGGNLRDGVEVPEK